MAPIFLHMSISTLVACVALGRGYTTQLRQRTSAAAPLLVPLLLLRVVPAAIVAAGMLPHQCYAWVEGLLTTTEAEFEKTPKSGSGGVWETSADEPGRLVKRSFLPAGGDEVGQTCTAGEAEVGLVPQRHAGSLAQAPGAARGPAAAAATAISRSQIPWSSIAEAAFVAYHLSWCVAFAAAGWAGDALRVAFPAAAVVCVWPAGHTAQQLADGWMRMGQPARVSALPAAGGPTLAKYAEPLLGESSRDDQTGATQGVRLVKGHFGGPGHRSAPQ
jgi:hypothetical protein